VYNDLLSSGDGTGEGLVKAYFSRVGWPTFLPTNEQDLFTRKVHELKQSQLDNMVKQGSIPLRADVDRVRKPAHACHCQRPAIHTLCIRVSAAASQQLHALCIV
jgi:hypothetical protein